MAKYRPDIKPPMWGPPDAVQYAVRVNAERMGIDSTKISVYAPVWDGAGIDLINFGDSSEPLPSSGCAWAFGGLNIPATGNIKKQFASKIINNFNDFSILLFGVPATRATSTGMLFQTRSTDATFLGMYQSSAADNRYSLNNSTFTNLGWKPKHISVVGDTTNIKGFFDGELKLTRDTPTAYDQVWLNVSSVQGSNVNTPVDALQGLLVLNVASSQDTLWRFTETPYALIMPVSRPVYFDLGAGGGTYTETLDTLITSISSAADRQAYRESVDTLIESGATVDAVTGMVEALLSLGVSASTAADVQGYADGVSDTIISASDTAAAQDYVDNLADTLVSASNVTDTTGAPPLAESLLTTAVSASSVSAAQAYVETVTALAVSASSLGEVLGLLEQLGTVGESISAVSDRQLYYDNVAIVALSSSRLAEVGAYVEQVGVAAVSASSLTDVLVGSFVGRYVFADYCRPRSFADYARARSFEDYCRPRGRRLQ